MRWPLLPPARRCRCYAMADAAAASDDHDASRESQQPRLRRMAYASTWNSYDSAHHAAYAFLGSGVTSCRCDAMAVAAARSPMPMRCDGRRRCRRRRPRRHPASRSSQQLRRMAYAIAHAARAASHSAQDACHAGHVQDLVMSQVAVMSSTPSHSCHRCAGCSPAIVGLHAERAMHAGMQSGMHALLCSRQHETCSALATKCGCGVEVAGWRAGCRRARARPPMPPPRTSSGDTAQALGRAIGPPTTP